MKKSILIIMLLAIVPSMEAQKEWVTDFYVQLSIDPKMAIEGPYKGKSNDIGATFNGEFSIGFEKSIGMHGFRGSSRIEIHPAIDYTKATWLSLEYMLKDVLPGLSGYVGPEMLTIYRINPNYDFTDPNNYLKHENSTLLVGANAEIQYIIPSTNFGIATNINVFQAEKTVSKYGKKTRYDVMVSLLYKF